MSGVACAIMYNVWDNRDHTKNHSVYIMRIERVLEMCRSDTNEAEQHAKLFPGLRSTANTGSVT